MTSWVGNPVPLVSAAAGFPHAVPPNVVRVVARAIQHAWSVISADPGKHLIKPSPSSPLEDVYTYAVYNILDQMLGADEPAVPGFSGDFFDGVTRGESVANYNGTAINKQPDLIIRLADRPLLQFRSLVGIVIESKVVSMSRPVSKYTTEGLSRFVQGDYGWTMTAGMMLAYQHRKHRPIQSLEKQLEVEKGLLCAPQKGKYMETQAAFSPLSGVSVHDRSWSYLCGDSPGPIWIWHMWDLIAPEL